MEALVVSSSTRGGSDRRKWKKVSYGSGRREQGMRE